MIAHSSLHIKTILLTLIPLSNEFSKLEIYNNSISCQITVAEHIRHMLQQFCGPKTFPVYSQIPQTKKGNIFRVQTCTFQSEMVKYHSQFRNSTNWLFFFFFFLSKTRFNSILYSHAHKYTSLELSESIRLPNLHDEF